MKKLIVGMVAAALCGLMVSSADAGSKDVKAIKALEQRYVDAVKAKDAKAIVACYVNDPDLVVFDLIPPRQFKGPEAWLKDWSDVIAATPGPINVEMSDLEIVANGKIGYGHNIQKFSQSDKDGKVVETTTRVSNGYRKVDGKWLIAHEHISVPVDLATGKPDMTSKP